MQQTCRIRHKAFVFFRRSPLRNQKQILPHQLRVQIRLLHTINSHTQVRNNILRRVQQTALLPIAYSTSNIQSTEPKTLHLYGTPFGLVDPDWKAPRISIVRSFNNRNKIAQWGMVMVRTTYTSPSKWDLFLEITKERTRNYLRANDALDLWDSLTWTILEEMEGADVVHCSERFTAWVATEGMEELKYVVPAPSAEAGEDGNYQWYGPRYETFILVDEAVVESVFSDYSNSIDFEEDRRSSWCGKGMNYLVVVEPRNLLLHEEDWKETLEVSREKGEPFPWSEIGEEDWFVKKVQGTDVFSVYLNLISLDGFEYFFSAMSSERYQFCWTKY